MVLPDGLDGVEKALGVGCADPDGFAVDGKRVAFGRNGGVCRKNETLVEGARLRSCGLSGRFGQMACKAFHHGDTALVQSGIVADLCTLGAEKPGTGFHLRRGRNDGNFAILRTATEHCSSNGGYQQNLFHSPNAFLMGSTLSRSSQPKNWTLMSSERPLRWRRRVLR